MLRSCRNQRKVPWLTFWRKVGLALLVILIPTPYYLRLVIYYCFEYDEVMARKEAARRLGVEESFDGSLVRKSHHWVDNEDHIHSMWRQQGKVDQGMNSHSALRKVFTSKALGSDLGKRIEFTKQLRTFPKLWINNIPGKTWSMPKYSKEVWNTFLLRQS
jgi:hypothetical protein